MIRCRTRRTPGAPRLGASDLFILKHIWNNHEQAALLDAIVQPVLDQHCVSCHNDHKDSPRRDFKIGEVMGGVVIRIPVEG